MNRFADEEAPDITTAMNNIKSRYLNNIRSKHESNPNFFSNRPSILEVIENNMSEWENLCLRKIFDESDLVVNNKISSPIDPIRKINIALIISINLVPLNSFTLSIIDLSKTYAPKPHLVSNLLIKISHILIIENSE